MVRRTGACVKKLAIVALLVVAGCRGQTTTAGPRAGGASTAREAVERFLATAKSQDYDGMGLVFGSKAGPARATIEHVELQKRQFIFMRCFRHDRSQIGIETGKPTGERSIGAQVWYKDLTATTNFTLVQGPNERWYVEQFEPDPLQRICASL